MTCPLHPSNGEFQDKCPSCVAGSPPDLGVTIGEETTTTERIG